MSDGLFHRQDSRFWIPLTATLLIANVGGALVLIVFLAFLVPLPEVEDPASVARANIIVGITGAALLVPIGILLSSFQLRPLRRWLRSGLRAEDDARRRVLHAPARVLIVPGTLWLLAACVFGILNLGYSSLLALTIVVGIVLGGLSTGAISYFVVQRLLRPLAARVLTEAGHDHLVRSGVGQRVILAWLLGTCVPVLAAVLVSIGVLTDALPASASQVAVTTIALGAMSIIAGLIVIVFTSRSLSDAMRDLHGAMQHVRRGQLDVRVTVNDGGEVGLLQVGFNDMVAGLGEREQLRDLFGRQVGAAVAEAALERGDRLGGEERLVAVMFCDLVGSTRLATARSPNEVVDLLNRFFSIIVEVVAEQGGTVNKFLGDAAMCIFGAPIHHSDPAGAALRAARLIRARLDLALPGYDAGIGVSAGDVIAGNVGSRDRFEYTVIGDSVNEAARLTDLAKDDSTRVLAASAAVTLAEPEERELWVAVGRKRLRGRLFPTALLHPAASVELPPTVS